MCADGADAADGCPLVRAGGDEVLDAAEAVE
jgi:hypothetical protein